MNCTRFVSKLFKSTFHSYVFAGKCANSCTDNDQSAQQNCASSIYFYRLKRLWQLFCDCVGIIAIRVLKIGNVSIRKKRLGFEIKYL